MDKMMRERKKSEIFLLGAKRITTEGMQIAKMAGQDGSFVEQGWEKIKIDDDNARGVDDSLYLELWEIDGSEAAYVGQSFSNHGYFICGGLVVAVELAQEIDELGVFEEGTGARATRPGALFGAAGRLFRQHLSKRYQKTNPTMHYRRTQHAKLIGAYRLFRCAKDDSREMKIALLHLWEWFFIWALRSCWSLAVEYAWNQWCLATRRTLPPPFRSNRKETLQIETGLEGGMEEVMEHYLTGKAVVGRSFFAVEAFADAESRGL